MYNNNILKMRLEEWNPIPLFNFAKEGVMANIEERVHDIIKPKVEKLGYELYDVEYIKERQRLFFKNIYR